MSDIFSKMKDTINKGTKKIGAKSSNLIEVNKIKVEVANIKRKKQSTLADIGAQVYLMRSDENVDLSSLEEQFDKVALFDQQVDDYNAQIDELNAVLEERLKEADMDDDVVDVESFTEETAEEVETEEDETEEEK